MVGGRGHGGQTDCIFSRKHWDWVSSLKVNPSTCHEVISKIPGDVHKDVHLVILAPQSRQVQLEVPRCPRKRLLKS